MTTLLDLFKNETNRVRVLQGEYLFKEGEPSLGVMYVLLSGNADIRVNHLTVEEAIAGAVIGEMGIIHSSEPRSASVLAMTDCEFVEIGPKRFSHLVSANPDFALEVMRALADRLRRADRMLE